MRASCKFCGRSVVVKEENYFPPHIDVQGVQHAEAFGHASCFEKALKAEELAFLASTHESDHHNDYRNGVNGCPKCGAYANLALDSHDNDDLELPHTY